MSQSVEMVSNIHHKTFALNVRRNSPQPSIFVRSFSAITTGSVEMMIQGQTTLILHAGDSFLMPPRTPHNAMDTRTPTNPSHSTLRFNIPSAVDNVSASVP